MIDDIIETACAVFELPRAALTGPSRAQHIVLARQAAMLALRRRTHLSLVAIGQLLGRSDHTTVSYGIAQAEKRCAVDPDYRAHVSALLDVPDLFPAPRPAPLPMRADVRLRWALASAGGIVTALAA